MNEKIEKALNDQINRELYSAYLYLSMAAYCDVHNLKGAAHWNKIQATEEMGHVLKFYNFIVDREGTVRLKGIESPPVEWKSVSHVFDEVLKHERYISKNIHDLVSLAQDERDHPTYNFLQWFVTEQVEEEATVKEIIDQLRLIAEAPGGMYMLDKDLGARPVAANPLLPSPTP